MNRNKTKKRILLSAVVLGLLSVVTGAGSFALWTTTSASTANLFNTPTIAISSDKAGAAIATLSNMVPGDSIGGVTTITNTSTDDMTNYSLIASVTAPASPFNALTTDAVNGLQVAITRCSVAWTGSGQAATCGGVSSAVFSGPITNGSALGTYGQSLAPNAWCSASGSAAERTARGITCDATLSTNKDYLKFVVSLPAAAATTEEGLSTTLSFTFSGQQPPAHSF